jgi:hypothetical protein
MYVGNRVVIKPGHWNPRVKRWTGQEVTVINPDFASGLYIEIATPEGESLLVERDQITLVKNPLDL